MKEIQWIQDNTFSLPEPETCTNADFEPIRTYIAGKRIVWIGENSHGISQNNTLKAKLISFLYEEMNYKVIAFESGLSECYSANGLKKCWSAEEIMQQSIFSLWRTSELVPLFQLIKERDLTLAGIDFQPSSRSNPLRELLLKRSKLDVDTIDQLHRLTEASTRWYTKIGQCRAKRGKLPAELLHEFEEEKAAIFQSIAQLKNELRSHKTSQVLVMLHRFLVNTEVFFNSIILRSNEYAKCRDHMMAENLEWLLTELYPNEKVIVWAHNFHIFKNYKTLMGYKPVGSLLSKKITEDSYYIGLFTYQGTIVSNDGSEYPMQKPRKKSLEDYLNYKEAEVGFLDFSRMIIKPENKWISRRTIILDSGSFERLIVPNKQLDAVFFIKKVSPPNYLNK